MHFFIEPSPIFSFDECLVFLDRNKDENLFLVENEKVNRLLQFGENQVPMAMYWEEEKIKIDIDDKHKEFENNIRQYVINWLDLNRDLAPFYRLLQQNERLSHFTEDFCGLRIIGVPDLFESLCWTIIGQQINLAFAYKLKNRLTQQFGQSTEWNNKRLWHFPSPEALVEIRDEFRESNQFSRSKVKYLMNTAEVFVSGQISLKKLQAIDSFEERQALLTSVKGIGEWSANYALMKTLHQPEAIPFGDTGLTQALYNLGIIKDRKDRPAIEAFFKTVKGWEAYTSFYLWRSLYK